MPDFNPAEFEGYQEAVRTEQLLRDEAFLGLTKDLCGFEVRQVTMRDWLILRIAQHPLLFRRMPTPGQLQQFLTLMSADGDKQAVIKKCRSAFCPIEFSLLGSRVWAFKTLRKIRRAKDVIVAAFQYLDDTFMDQPAGSCNGHQASYYSDAATYCAFLGANYHVSMQDAMEKVPLRVGFQLMRVIEAQREDGLARMGNRSQAIVVKVLAEKGKNGGHG